MCAEIDIRDVLDGDYCIGCGVCIPLAQESLQMSFCEDGLHRAVLSTQADARSRRAAAAVCPFSGIGPDESTLAGEAFGRDPACRYEDPIGYFRDLFAGRAVDCQAAGTSGGVARWILADLLRRGQVDAVICVQAETAGGPLFRYAVMRTPEEVYGSARSAYYPVSLSDVLAVVSETPGRYALTGVPCFQKAVRLLKQADARFAERIPFQLGLVCGQWKSAMYTDYLVRLAGGDPAELDSVCYREATPGQRADQYSFVARGRFRERGVDEIRLPNRAVQMNWSTGLLKPRACDFCDDVFAETADAAVMDAWLPEFLADGRGTSLVILRDKRLHECVQDGVKRGELQLATLSPERVTLSQRGALTHRRRGLRHRLEQARRNKRWTPPKRVGAARDTSCAYRLQQAARAWARRKSFCAAACQSGLPGVSCFERRMRLPRLALRLADRLVGAFSGRPQDVLEWRRTIALDTSVDPGAPP